MHEFIADRIGGGFKGVQPGEILPVIELERWQAGEMHECGLGRVDPPAAEQHIQAVLEPLLRLSVSRGDGRRRG